MVIFKSTFRGQNYIMVCTSPFTSFVAFLWMHSSTSISFLNCGAQNCTWYSWWGRTNTWFDWLVGLCLVRLRTRFASLAARAHCWLILSLQSTSTRRSPSTGLLSSHSSPNLCLCLALLPPRCRIRPLFPSSARQVTLSQKGIKLVRQDFPFVNPC